MGATAALVKRNVYVDSITLLQVTSEVIAFAGVQDASLVMATELNRDLLRDAGLLLAEAEAAGANDLVIGIRAADQAALDAALAHAESLLAGRRTVSETAARARPRSVRAAHRARSGANLAVISVPGPYAAGEARQALAEGLHVFLFSDNVPLADEIDLKRRARERGLLVMGPDCGTAILSGVGLGFANVVRRGPIGVVGASGTGIQEVVSLIHQAGGGISHAIGTGSHDLHADVGGITTLQALDLLRHDTNTQAIVLISKPSDKAVAVLVLEALAATGKRAVAYLQGLDLEPSGRVEIARNLEEAAGLVAPLARVDGAAAAPPNLRLVEGQHQIRGLYCGGTLCQEAFATVGGASSGHDFIDFGDDEYTRGRAHPMIDPTLRNQAIVEAGADARVAVVLMDVILGLAAHPDPAGATAPAIREARAAAAAAGRELGIVAHVVGTDQDPQAFARQEATLLESGVQLARSNVEAARLANQLVQRVAI